jgi:amino acid adenylation domain-containing protein
LRWGCGTCVELPETSIVSAFERRVSESPSNIAIEEHTGRQISYQELNLRASSLACELQRRGVRKGDHVGLFLTRSIEMVIGLLAILKCGAAYIPQSIGIATQSQMQHILQVSHARLTLTTSACRDAVPVEDASCLEIDRWLEKQAAGCATTTPAFQSDVQIEPDCCCFVLFTSGTTGKPNGVRVTHRNICNILLTDPGRLGMAPGIKVAQLLNIAFDMAAWETLGALMNGATLLIRGKDFNQTASRANVIIATPSILCNIDRDLCKEVETVAVAGEPCARALADRWAAHCNFYNCCGPTETTIVNTMQLHHTKAGLLTIGKPTANNTVYILDANRKPCAIGETGEMWAGGSCVTAGYLNNPELTAERYAPDPYLGGDHMMFNTRDLGRWTDNGELEHLGRTDDQVKVRGFRVELDSVSAALETIPGCTRAATLKFSDRALVAFIAPQNIDPEAATRQVASQLPYYCVPEKVFALDQLPLTSRGKIDKRKLLQLAEAELSELKETAGATA